MSGLLTEAVLGSKTASLQMGGSRRGSVRAARNHLAEVLWPVPTFGKGVLMSDRKLRPLTRAEMLTLRSQLEAVLGAIDQGDLKASPATRYRLEGAITGLDAALGRPSSLSSEHPTTTS